MQPSKLAVILNIYTTGITTSTTGDQRLGLSADFVTKLTQGLAEGSVSVSQQECRDIISSLIRVTLNFEHTTSDLQDFLLSPDVVTLVRSLITATGNAGVILKGMMEGVYIPGIGVSRFADYGVKLLNRWFTGDGYKAPTNPGFIYDMFDFIETCWERQRELGQSLYRWIKANDDFLLPLVASVLNNETAESINKRNRFENTPLHDVSGWHFYPTVTSELLKHPGIDVNARNISQGSPLVFMFERRGDFAVTFTSVFSALISHPATDVSLPDIEHRTVIHHLCGYLDKAEQTSDLALKMMTEVCRHKTVTMEMLQLAFSKVVTFNGEHKDALSSILCIIAARPEFNASVSAIFGDKSAVWFCVEHMGEKRHLLGYKLWETLLTRSDCDLNAIDGLGNSALFHLSVNLTANDAIQLMNQDKLKWDFTKKNVVGQTAADFYEESPNKNSTVQKFLAAKCGKPKERKSTGAAMVEVVTVTLDERLIDWTIGQPTPADTSTPQNISTAAFYRDKQRSINTNKVYDLSKKLKGKACILSIPEFKSPDLSDLLGYKEDEKNLVTLWKKMGFTVLTTRYDGQYHLTAKEIEQAVKEFGSKLTDADQCAVLCILSHGGDGFIYGSDGDTVFIRKLLSYLDNKNCPKMKGKPKFVILQTCQGDKTDAGVLASPASGTRLSAIVAATGVRLPSISDIIVCSPSMPGYTSFVWTDPTGGSVFINALISVFSQNAHDTDLQTMLTLVNAEVSGKDIPLQVSGSSRTVDRKQMSHFDSCLTKLLYFFPGIAQ